MSSRDIDLRMELPPTLDAIEKFCAEFQLWREGACAKGIDFVTVPRKMPIEVAKNR